MSTAAPPVPAARKQDLPSWRAKRDRWFSSPRPRLKALPGSGGGFRDEKKVAGPEKEAGGIAGGVACTSACASSKASGAARAEGSVRHTHTAGAALATEAPGAGETTSNPFGSLGPSPPLFSARTTTSTTSSTTTTHPAPSASVAALSPLVSNGESRREERAKERPADAESAAATDTKPVRRIVRTAGAPAKPKPTAAPAAPETSSKTSNPFGNLKLTPSPFSITKTTTAAAAATATTTTTSSVTSGFGALSFSASGRGSDREANAGDLPPDAENPSAARPVRKIVRAAGASNTPKPALGVPASETVNKASNPFASLKLTPSLFSATTTTTTTTLSTTAASATTFGAALSSAASGNEPNPAAATTDARPATQRKQQQQHPSEAPGPAAPCPGTGPPPPGGPPAPGKVSATDRPGREAPVAANEGPPRLSFFTLSAPASVVPRVPAAARPAADRAGETTPATTAGSGFAANHAQKTTATTPSNPTPTPTSAYPPMASAAPKNPFATKNTKKTTEAATSTKPKPTSAYPPMASAAPKNPFAAKNAQKTTEAATPTKPKPTSAYPPMASAAPKNPFAAKTAQKTTEATPTKPKPTSAYPPMASAAPKNPFGVSASSGVLSSGSSQGTKSNLFGGSLSPFSSFSGNKASSFLTTSESNTTSIFGTKSLDSSPFSNTTATIDGDTKAKPKGTDSDPKGTDSEDDKDYRTRLTKFYEKYNPSKIDSVDANLKKYEGREEEMFRKLEAKYNPAAPAPVSAQFPPPAGNGPRCYLEFSVEGDGETNEKRRRRVVVQLYRDKAPLAADNFRCLCTGEVKTHTARNKPLRYLGSKVHRIVPGFCIQAGDFTTGDGRGGQSIYPPNSEHGDAWGKFKDEPSGFMNHSRKGLLSMANSGKNTNSSQFFFTLKAVPYLNGKHVVFGEVLEGMDVLEELSEVEINPKTSRPIRSVAIAACGAIDEETGVDLPSAGSNDEKEKLPESTPTSIPSVFGSTSPFSSKSVFGGSRFGSNIPTSQTTKTSVFGGKALTSQATETAKTTPAFGTTATLGSGFGSSKSSGSKGFGAFSASASDSISTFGKTTPAFGTTATLGSGFGSNKASGSKGFGSFSAAASGSAPAFGTTANLGSGGFGALAAASPSNGTPSFGSTTTVGGGAGGKGFGAFGSSAPTVGGSPGFGGLAAAAASSKGTPPFGFGSAPKSGNNGSSPFAFGESGKKTSIFGNGSQTTNGSDKNDAQGASPFSAFSGGASSPSRTGFSSFGFPKTS